MNWIVQKTDIVLCRIYRKAASNKSMEHPATQDYLDKEEPVVSGDNYGEKSHSVTLDHDSCQLSNPVEKSDVFPLHYNVNDEGVGSSDPGKSNVKEDSFFDCLEPIMEPIIFSEETTVLKTPTACNPAQLELPKLSMDSWLSQPISTYSLLPTPSPFHIPLF